MKKILIILTVLLFTACGDFKDTVILETNNLTKPYVVVDINQFNTQSVYVLSTRTDYFDYDDNIKVIDENGKFAIGDSVYLNITKK